MTLFLFATVIVSFIAGFLVWGLSKPYFDSTTSKILQGMDRAINDIPNVNQDKVDNVTNFLWQSQLSNKQLDRIIVRIKASKASSERIGAFSALVITMLLAYLTMIVMFDFMDATSGRAGIALIFLASTIFCWSVYQTRRIERYTIYQEILSELYQKRKEEIGS